MSISISRQEDLQNPGHIDRPLTERRISPPASAGNYGDSATYDRYMGRWSARLARQFLKFIALEKAEEILDIGAGTGSLTAALATSTSAKRIVGIDPIEPFVRTARQRFGNARVAFDSGDVDGLPYGDGEFDACLAQLSFHHFPDGEQALKEMRRVTRRGGLIAACEWDAGAGMEMFHLLWATLAAIDSEAVDPRSRRAYSDQGGLRELWRANGLAAVQEEAILVPLEFSSFDDFWIPFIEGPSSVLRPLGRLSTAQQEDFRRRIKQSLLGNQTDGPIRLLARAWAVSGRVL